MTSDEIIRRLMDIHDCEDDHCGCGIHLLIAELFVDAMQESAQQEGEVHYPIIDCYCNGTGRA